MCLRSEQFYFRRRVPSGVRNAIGRDEIWRSLRTDSFKVALRRFPFVAAQVEAEIERSRSILGLSFDSTLIEPFEDDQPVETSRTKLPSLSESSRTANHGNGESVDTPEANITIGEAYGRYMSDPTHHWAIRTRETYDTARRFVLSTIESETPIRSVTRAHVRDLIEILRFLPRNSTKRFPRLAPKDASERQKQEGLGAVISTANANAYLSSLSTFWNWAIDEEMTDRNPVRGLRLPDEVAKRDKRNPFSPQQLGMIFSAPLFTGCVNGDRGYVTPGSERPQNARYWVPLIALHTGLRLNEIAQLDVTDLRSIDGIPCIVVTTESLCGTHDKILKTGASERVMPIHRCLLDLGLIPYAESQERSGKTKLFAEIEPGTRGIRAVAFSKWFTQFLTHAGARRERTCFHSFRHNYRDELRVARIDHDIAMALGGWTNGPQLQGTVSENYGRGHRIEVLAESVNRLAFLDIDLSHLAR